MTQAAESTEAQVRRREVTWEDLLVSAALTRDLSGLDYQRAIAEGRISPAPIAALLGMSILQVERDRGQAYTTLELKVNIVKALTTKTPSVVVSCASGNSPGSGAQRAGAAARR
jgi:hypothetical protein